MELSRSTYQDAAATTTAADTSAAASLHHSVNIRPVDAIRVALGAGANGTITPFRIYVEDDAAVAERSCWLKMLDATVS